MKSRQLSVAVGGIAAAVVLSAFIAGCPQNAGPSVGTLTLRLSSDPLVTTDGNLVALSLQKGELLNTSGGVVKNAAINADGSASFDLGGLGTGEYFIRVNDSSSNLVPTRVDDTSVNIDQFVGQTLRASVIGSLGDPVYRFKSYASGQLAHEVIRYSDGLSIGGEFPYVVVSFKTEPQRFEVRVLGTGAQLTSLTPNVNIHPSTPGVGVEPFASYALRTTGLQHHSDSYARKDVNCVFCHGSASLNTSLDTKAANWADITVATGWCYRCHYGKGGGGVGFVDPNQ